jgi:hypothetical protein
MVATLFLQLHLKPRCFFAARWLPVAFMKEQKSNSKTCELLSCGETSEKIGWKSTLSKGLQCLS